MHTLAPIVIIGAGQAGGRLALALREEGFTGAIRLIGEEKHLPYQRPPLSKQILLGEEVLAQLPFTNSEQFAKLSIDWIAGVSASQILPLDKQVILDNQETLTYGTLILATGGYPRSLFLPGCDKTNILYLRNMEDASRLKSQLLPGRSIGIIGGGFIGLEIASSAKQLGCEVVVIETADRLASRVIPAEISARLMSLHQRHGVDIRLSTGIERLIRDGSSTLLQLKTGETVCCDALIAGIGIVPNQHLAEAAGLAVGNGILVDQYLQTSQTDIYAIGDVAALPQGNGHQRVETWRNAEHQARFLAKHLTKREQAFHDTMWFWSDQFDEGLQVIGETGADLTPIIRLQSDEATLVIYLDDTERIRGAAGMGKEGHIAREIKLLERLIDMQKIIPPYKLLDPAQSLKSLLKGN
ncbi:NAD(P)/FAD-dependent oxidoreductase [Leeia oryzae]|uniref:NAD(P)/FAD-dependent oxidoreductase n=1 Tax=Leeia oryzae TaxID=356662 RepID=UPI000367B887|nr:FAD-dependent oxidoreductase [Leeia oryzae]